MVDEHLIELVTGEEVVPQKAPHRAGDTTTIVHDDPTCLGLEPLEA